MAESSNKKMISSPFIIMGVLATAAVIGFLSINNYQLRQETTDIAHIAERNDRSLDQATSDCDKVTADLKTKLASTESALKKINDEKAAVEAEIKKTGEDGNNNVNKANEEYNRVNNDLQVVAVKLNNLTEIWNKLGGGDLWPSEGAFSGGMSASTSDYDDVQTGN